jgi:hypothetical protein
MIQADGTIPFLCGHSSSNEELQATGGWLDGGGIQRQQPSACRFMNMKVANPGYYLMFANDIASSE